MNSAEFKSVRESLHLSVEWLATHLNVRRQSIQRWENGQHPIPENVCKAIQDLEVLTYTRIEEGTRENAAVIYVPRRDEDCEDGLPAAWHRMIAKQIATTTGATIQYKDNSLWVK